MTAATDKRTWPALIAVFIASFPLAFSGEVLRGRFEVMRGAGFNVPWPRLWLTIIDVVLLLIILRATIWLWLRNGWPRFSIWVWWVVGAGLTLALDALTTNGQENNPWANLATSLGYVVSLAILLAAVFKADPTGLLRRPQIRKGDQQAWKEFRGALPLLIGTLAAYVGSTAWNSVLERGSKRLNCGVECHGAITPEYFAQLSQVIPLLLVAVGIEAGMFRTSLKDSVPRAMTITTVVILCAAEVLALSALPSPNRGEPSDILYKWHEYFAFIVTWEACFIALSMLVWALISRSVTEDRQDESFQSTLP
jgi:hypothetical protein